MYNESESLLWLLRFIADSALKRSDIGKIIIGALHKDGFLDRIKREKTDNQDVKAIYEHFESFVKIADEVYQGNDE